VFPLVLDVDIIEVWLATKRETFCDIADGDHHFFVQVNALDVFDVGVY
jgi:hypothetical protein